MQSRCHNHNDLGRPCLLANYNRPEPVSYRADSNVQVEDAEGATVLPRYEEKSRLYDFRRAEHPENELSTWEAARATSAAPKIFRPYTHALTGNTFFDGGIYFNNPVEVVLRQHKLVWPRNRPEAPDVLLSLGTGFTPNKKARSLDTSQTGIRSHYKQQMKIAVDHIESSQNSQAQHQITLDRMSKEHKAHLVRFTLCLSRLPKPDDVSAIQFLKDEIRADLNGRWSEIRNLANRLLVSSFYFEPISGSNRKNGDGSTEMSGSIKCRTASHLPKIEKLGELLRRRCQEAYNNPESLQHSPCFVIEEKSKGREAQQVLLADKVIRGMIENRQFNMGHIRIVISSPVSITTLSPHRENIANDTDLQNAMSDIHIRFGAEPTKAPNNSISGFPRFWDEELTRPAKSRMSLSPSRQRQLSRRTRPTWAAPDAKMVPVLGQYAEQKNPGLATDADLQAVKANFLEPTIVHVTPVQTPVSESSESFQRHVHVAESPHSRAQDDWARAVKLDPDGPPDYTDITYVHQGGNSREWLAEMPDHSTADWRLTAEELQRDPFPHLRPDNDPFGPSVTFAATALQVPSYAGPSRWSSSQGSSRTKFSTSSGQSTQSIRGSETALYKWGVETGPFGRKSTGSVRETSDMYGSG